MKLIKDLRPESKRELLAWLEGKEINLDQVTDTTMVEDDPTQIFNSLMEWARARVQGREFPLLFIGEARKDLGKLRDIALEIASHELQEECFTPEDRRVKYIR